MTERQAFERWAIEAGFALIRSGEGYAAGHTDAAWAAWKCRGALAGTLGITP